MPKMKTPCVADVAGPWVEPDFRSGLIERCKRYWNVPIAELPNEILATYLRQQIALRLVIPEARKRLQTGMDDGSEMYEGELAKALAEADHP
jgi:CDI immunity proteins